MAYRDVVLADAPIGYWRLEETAGTQAADLSGNGRVGTCVGGVTRGQPGSPGTGLASVFNGTTGKIDLPSFTTPAAFSVEAWFKTTITTLLCIWSNRAVTPAPASTFFGLNTNQVFVYRYGANAPDHVGTGIVVNNGAWHHTLYTFDGTTGRLYIDGVASTVVTPGVGGSAAVTAASAIGWDGPTGSWFPGTLDEVAVYGVALAPARAGVHYTAGLSAGFAGQPFAGEPFAGQPFAGAPFAGQT